MDMHSLLRHNTCISLWEGQADEHKEKRTYEERETSSICGASHGDHLLGISSLCIQRSLSSRVFFLAAA